jgi:anti-sigma regulatory factor (Ser/Thr protein kinase)
MTDTHFNHQALIYGSEQELVETAAQVAREGIERGEPVFVVLRERKARALREALGRDAAAVDFADAVAWYDAPPRTLRAYARYMQEHGDRGRLHVIGELILDLAAPAVCREWMRYESMLNFAFQGAPASITCVYDKRDLPETLLADVRRTHPEMVSGTSPAPSPDYLDLPSFTDLIDAQELEQPAVEPRELDFTWDLDDLRAHAEAEALAAGVGRARVPEVVLAVNEVATNAVMHGGGGGRMRTWAEPRHFVCEITDDGSGIADPHVGYLDSGTGTGLWVTRQLTELVEVRGGPSGTTVRIHVSR